MRGDPDTVAAIRADRIVPYVETTELEAGSNAGLLPVKVRGLPDTVGFVRVDPTEVLLTLSGRPLGPRRVEETR